MTPPFHRFSNSQPPRLAGRGAVCIEVEPTTCLGVRRKALRPSLSKAGRLELAFSPTAQPARRSGSTKCLLRACSTAALTGGCLLLAACAVGPDYKRPEVAAPVDYKETPDAAAVATPVLATDWWTLFGDEDLNQLAGEVLAANQDIQAALARVDQARALSGSARGDFWLRALSVDASARRARTPGSDTTPAHTATSYSLPLDLSYEIDIWGRLRRQYESYHNLEQASAADFAVDAGFQTRRSPTWPRAISPSVPTTAGSTS